MNRFELERILSLIEANAQTNQPRVRTEVLKYIQDHEEEVLAQLRTSQQARVSTSLGTVILRLSDLQAAVA
jgi:hypothetical protein